MACSPDEGGSRDVAQMAGRVFDDPAGDVDPTPNLTPPPDGIGDVRRVAVDADDGVLSLTVALAEVPAESPAESRATRFDVRFGGGFTSARSTFDELVIGGRADDRGLASAGVPVYHEVQEYNLDLCRGRAAYSSTRALIRLEVPLSCLPGDRLSVSRPTLEVTTRARGVGGTDVVDLDVRRLTAP